MSYCRPERGSGYCEGCGEVNVVICDDCYKHVVPNAARYVREVRPIYADATRVDDVVIRRVFRGWETQPIPEPEPPPPAPLPGPPIPDKPEEEEDE